MADIIDLISADHLHIMRWAAELGELSGRHRAQESGPALVTTWNTVAALIDLHMRADDEICGPKVFGTDPREIAVAQQYRDAHEDIREILRATSLQPPGSPLWWHLARKALAAWAEQFDRERHGPLADRRQRADRALREELARQWRAFTDAEIRDRYPRAPAQTPTHQLRQDSRAPAAVPRLADPVFGPLACTCSACTQMLDRLLLRQRQHQSQ